MQRQKAIDDATLAAFSGLFDAAETEIDRAERLGAPAGRIRMLRGLVAWHRGKPLEAVSHLEQAVRLLPDNVAARSLLAVAHAGAGQLDACLWLLKDTERLSPTTAEDYLFKGWTLVLQAAFSEGMGMLDVAIRKRDSPLARMIRAQGRAWLAMDTGKPADAEAALEDAMVAKSMLPDNPLALGRRLRAQLIAAHLFGQTGDEARRRACVAEAARDAKSLTAFVGALGAHDARAEYFEDVGDEPAALRERRLACDCPEASSGDFLWYAIGLYGVGASEEALTVLDRYHQRISDTSLAMDQLLLLTGLPDGRERALAAYRVLPESALSGVQAIDAQLVLRLLGRRDEAVAASRRARQQFTEAFSSQLAAWAQSYADYLCDVVSASELLAVSGESRAKQCEAHYVIGLDCLARGDRAGAADHFRRAVDTYALGHSAYPWSRAFLKRMEQDPAWPPWLPLDAGSATQPTSAPIEHEP